MTTASTVRPPSDATAAADGGTAATRAYSLLRSAIVCGDLQPGTPLVETALAQRLEMSRTPVREALRRLEQDEIAARGQRGLAVRRASPEEILALYDVLAVMEGMAARCAAAHRNLYDLRQLEGAVVREPSGTDGTSHDRARLNRMFHESFWRASHQPVLLGALGRLNVHLLRFPSTTLAYDDRWRQSMDEHRAIAAAIRDGCEQQAHDLAFEHMQHARDVRLRAWTEGAAAP